MEFISNKLNSLTGATLSGINEMRRKQRRRDLEEAENQQQQSASNFETEVKTSANITQLTAAEGQIPGLGFRHNNNNAFQRPVSSPFGGDSFYPNPNPQQAPPAIGFLLPPPAAATQSQVPPTPTLQATPSPSDHQNPIKPAKDEQLELTANAAGSTESLYDGDAWSRLWFQRVMMLSLIRLLLFIRKVYEDYQATKTYKSMSSHRGHFLVSAAALLLPTIVFTIYRVSRYLQLTLPSIRSSGEAPYPISAIAPAASSDGSREPAAKVNATRAATEDEREFREMKSALMAADKQPADSQLAGVADDGLVTARQTPTNLDEFHDSRSRSEQSLQAIKMVESSPLGAESHSPAPSTALVKDSPPARKEGASSVAGIREPEAPSRETVNLEGIPDKETTKIVIGASEQILHGVLFIFWQLKRQVDVMGYLVDRSCLWRKPRADEREQLEKLRVGSDGLEWFQDFYAAFLAILAQVYTLGLHWSTTGDEKLSGASAAGPALESLESLQSSTGRAVSSHLSLAATGLGGQDVLIMSELVVSSAVVVSLLVAVRRRDDGPLTLGLSMLGWGSIFASRIIVIALAFVHIGWRIMLSLVGLHILGITGWIYKIAIDSHNDKPSENEELKWDPEPDEPQQPDIELNDSGLETDSKRDNSVTQTSSSQKNVTSQWSIMEHVVLITQILTLFALPSLFYWPIMFNLKLHCRPFKYLVLIMSENFILIPAIWFTIASKATIGQWYLLGAVGSFTIMGFLFVFLYVCCKPSLTEYFARADELFNEAERSGIYFEFCSRVFKMPDLSKQAFRRLMNQQEQVEEYEVCQ